MARRTKKTVPARLRRRRRVRVGVAILIGALVIAVALDRLGVFGYEGNDWARYDQRTFEVVRVIDGTTVVVAPAPVGGDAETPVRLIGIDVPRAAALAGAVWAERARDYLAARVESTPVVLRLETTRTRDASGRLLAYLYVDDSENLNLTMIRDGHAYADRRGHHSLWAQFELTEAEARRAEAGLWAEADEAMMPDWRRQWLEEIDRD